MQDFIILYFLMRYMGNLAAQKNQPVFRWRMYTLAGWFTGGLVGSMVSQLLFNLKNPMDLFKQQNFVLLSKVMILYYLFTIIGYHVVRTALKRKPDVEQPQDGSIL